MTASLLIVLVLSISLGTAIAVASSERACGLDDRAISDSDGSTVTALQDNDLSCCDVGGWANITQVEAGYRHTVGLKTDGTVVATRDTEDQDYGECDVSGWTNIIYASA